jgi:hypothetical protein
METFSTSRALNVVQQARAENVNNGRKKRKEVMLLMMTTLAVLTVFRIYSSSNQFSTAYSHLQKQVWSPTTAKPKEDTSAPHIANMIQLNTPSTNLAPISFGACCGIGHRLSRIIPTIVYANRQSQNAYAAWTDVPWSALFNDTDFVQEGYKQNATYHYGNSHPRDWGGQKRIINRTTGTVFDRYGVSMCQAVDMPVVQALLVSMRDSLTPLVLSYLDPVRRQTHAHEWEAAMDQNSHHVKVCAHIRHGNNETGDWAGKTWRHIDLESVLQGTRSAMNEFVLGTAAKKRSPHVSVFVASDNADVRPWFETNLPKGWKLIKPTRELPKPDNGVWFGEHGSKTADVLNQTMKTEVLAEATAEIFALGECDALFIPNYSSFTLSSIVLTRARKKSVFFRTSDGIEFHEMNDLLGESNARKRT